MNILNHYPAITSRVQTYGQTTLSNNTTSPTDELYLSVPTLGVSQQTPHLTTATRYPRDIS